MSYITLEEVAKLVENDRDIDFSFITTKSRKREIREARQLFHYIAEKWCLASLQEIANYSNLKKHETVIHSCKVVTNDVVWDDDISKSVELIESKINELGYVKPNSRKLRLPTRKVKKSPSVVYALRRATTEELLREIKKRIEK